MISQTADDRVPTFTSGMMGADWLFSGRVLPWLLHLGHRKCTTAILASSYSRLSMTEIATTEAFQTWYVLGGRSVQTQ